MGRLSHPDPECRSVSVGQQPPADRPVLSLEPLAPLKCAGPITEVAVPHDTTVDEPDDSGAVRTRTDHGVREQAVRALHSPQDDGLCMRRSVRGLGHAARRGKGDTSTRTRRFSRQPRVSQMQRFQAGRLRWDHRGTPQSPTFLAVAQANREQRAHLVELCLIQSVLITP